MAYLLLNRHRRRPREVLAALFWGDSPEARARACLATALWRLRRALGPASEGGRSWIVVAPSGDVAFDCGDGCRVDAADFEVGVRAALSRPASALSEADADALEQTLELYTGELLEGVYHEWAQRERDRFHQLYHNGAWHLMRTLAHLGQVEHCATWGERILRDDPLREDVYRELMRVYAAAGCRALAVQQYHRCRHALDEELGVDPAPETTVLFHAVAESAASEAASVPSDSDSRQALRRMHDAWATFETARGELARTIALVEQLVPTILPANGSAL